MTDKRCELQNLAHRRIFNMNITPLMKLYLIKAITIASWPHLEVKDSAVFLAKKLKMKPHSERSIFLKLRDSGLIEKRVKTSGEKVFMFTFMNDYYLGQSGFYKKARNIYEFYNKTVYLLNTDYNLQVIDRVNTAIVLTRVESSIETVDNLKESISNFDFYLYLQAVGEINRPIEPVDILEFLDPQRLGGALYEKFMRKGELNKQLNREFKLKRRTLLEREYKYTRLHKGV